jgi:fructuronate reductase
VSVGIVHLGIGAFHRAHEAIYIDDVLANGDRRWGITGVSLRGADVRDALTPQDGLYTVQFRGGDAPPRVIGSVREVLVAPESPEAVLRRLSDPAVAIVSLTITEKGYCHVPATGELDESHPLIRADLADPVRPRSAIAMLAMAIARRRAEGARPFTILSCDNLPANGVMLRRVLARFAALVSPDLGAYIEGEIATPSTMVDRIVPATTQADRREISTALGVQDEWPVIAEPFSQWVIEDRFSAGRPDFEAVGAELVGEVAPYEQMKLRLLNGAHSALAYLGALGGLETVAEAMAHPVLATFIAGLIEDASATLTTPSATELAQYRKALLTRFRNTSVRHRLLQIAMDGSQKLPQRLLNVIHERLAKNLQIKRHALAVAAWIRFVTRIDALGAPVPVSDPLAQQLAAIGREGRLPEDIVGGALRLRAIFGDDLPSNAHFVTATAAAFTALAKNGPLHTVAALEATLAAT